MTTVLAEMQQMDIELTYTEECLGTASNNPEVQFQFIAKNAPTPEKTAEEVQALIREIETDKDESEAGLDETEVVKVEKVEDLINTMTLFPRENGKPHLWDYQIKGMFKDACGLLSRAEGTKSSKLFAYKKIIDGLIFIEPRKIIFELPPDGGVGLCYRPLRAQTPQGERMAIVRSETIPAGTKLKFSICYYNLAGAKTPKPKKDSTAQAGPPKVTSSMRDLIIEWLNYGRWRGLGQWRNSGKGKFTYQILNETKITA